MKSIIDKEKLKSIIDKEKLHYGNSNKSNFKFLNLEKTKNNNNDENEIIQEKKLKNINTIEEISFNHPNELIKSKSKTLSISQEKLLSDRIINEKNQTLDEIEKELNLPNILRNNSIFSTKAIYFSSLENALIQLKSLAYETNINLNTLKKIHSKCDNLIIKINEQYMSIQQSLLLKTLNKMNSHSMPSLTYFNLFNFRFLNYSFKEDNHIEYLIQIEDKILHKIWEFGVRYADLR